MTVTWVIYLKMLHFASVGFCHPIQDLEIKKECIELTSDCVLDGEEFSWCQEAMKEEFTPHLNSHDM